MKITTSSKIKPAVLAGGLTLMLIFGYFIPRVIEEEATFDAGGIASSAGPEPTSSIDRAKKASGIPANENDETQALAEIEKKQRRKKQSGKT